MASKKSQKTLESSKALSKVGFFFGFLTILTLPAAPLVGPLFCNRNTNNTCTLHSSLQQLPWIIALTSIFGVIAISLIIAGIVLRSKAKRNN